MNKTAYIFAVAALSTFSSVATQAADSRDRTVYGPTATAGLVEGRNAATVAASGWIDVEKVSRAEPDGALEQFVDHWIDRINAAR